MSAMGWKRKWSGKKFCRDEPTGQRCRGHCKNRRRHEKIHGGGSHGVGKETHPGGGTWLFGKQERKGWRCRLQKLESIGCLPKFHRSGTSIYRKKIDTQKVYRGTSICPTSPAAHGQAGGRGGGGEKSKANLRARGKSVQHPVFPSGRPPQY